MEKYEGSNAVLNAKSCVRVFAWLFIIAGCICCFGGFIGGYDVEWGVVIIGVSLLFFGGIHFVIADILIGFHNIVKASEAYLSSIEKNERAEVEDKSTESPEQE